jgi:hypothetical protein
MSSSNEREDRDPPDGIVATRVVVARRRSWAVPAIVVVALAIAALGFLGQKAVPPRPPVAPTPTAPPIAMDWTAIPLDPAAFRNALVGLVVHVPGGLLAFGQDRTDRHAIVWTSTDGRIFVRHDQPLGTFGGGVPDAAVQVGSGYVAVGYHSTVDGTTRDIWASADGAAWFRDPSPTGRGFDEVRTIVGSGGTAILVATVGGSQLLLSSDDGLLWTPTGDLDPTLGRAAYISAAVDSGDGYLAIGAVGSEDAIWRSPNGRAWSRIGPADPTLFAGVRLQSLFRTTTGFLVSGFGEGFGHSSSWVSDDGATWLPDTSGSLALRDRRLLLALDGGNLDISSEASGGGPGGLTAWADPGSPVDVPPPTTALADWNRQATVLDGHVLLLAGDPTTDPVEGWLGTLVGSGIARAAPTSSTTPGPSVPSGSPASSPSASPVATRPVNPPGGHLDWVRLTSARVLADDVRDISMSGVVSLGRGLVAYGTDGSDAVLWTSPDAGHWQRMPVSPTMHGALIRAVTGGTHGQLIAVGGVLTADGLETPAAWTSADGLTWVRAKVPALGGNGEMADVVAGRGRLVAVGWRDSDSGSLAAAWTSPDGGAWSLAPAAPGDGSGTAQAVAYAEAGYVAVGSSQPDGSNSVGAAWVSPDGIAWTKVPDQPAFAPADQTAGRFGGLSITDIVAGGPGVVAVGSQDSSTGPLGAIFTSRDGRSWTRLPPEPTLDGAYLQTVATWAGGLAIAGDISGYAGSDPVIYASPDGGAWTRLARTDLDPGRRDDPGGVTLAGIAPFGADLIGVGSGGDYPGRQQAAIWVGAPTGTLVPDHVCPATVDSLVVLASMTAADRAGCIDRRGVTVSALARANDGGCTADVPDELSGCGGSLELAPVERGQSLFTTPIDRSVLPTFSMTTFAPWKLTFTAGVAGPACVPTPAFNGVVYEPLDSVRLQCLGVLRLIAWDRIVRP